MRNEPRKIEYSIFYTVLGAAWGWHSNQQKDSFETIRPLFFFVVQFLPDFAVSIATRRARPGLLAGPARDTLQSYVTLARLALTSISIEYLRSHGDRAHE